MRALGAALAFAVALPLLMHRVVVWRLRDRALPELSTALGQPVDMDDAEVGLTGTLTLSRVRIGDRLAADSVEAAVGLTHLLHGTFVADEVRVTRPRLRARLVDGRLDAGVSLRGLRRGAPTGDGSALPARRFRILIDGGELVVDLGEHGEIRARGVEIHPQEGGVRVVAGQSTADLRWGPWRARAGFERAGLDVELPALRVDRVALDGGSLAVSAGGPELRVEGLVVLRGRDTRVTGRLGGDRPVALTVDDDAARVEAEELPLAPFAAVLPSWIEPTGTVSGSAAVGKGWQVDASVRLLGTRFSHPLLAGTPVPFDGAIELRGGWDRAARAGSGRLRLGLARVSLDAEIEVALDEAGALRRAALQASLPRAACADVLAAVPRALAAPLVGIDLIGSLGGRVDVAFDLERPDEARLDVDLDVGCQVLRDESAAAVAKLAGAYAHTLPDGRTRVLAREDPDFVPLADLPRHVAGAFVAAEDARFFDHHGFDEEQLRRSFTIDVAAGRVERGGSTISQQLVKNLWLSRERTLGRKLVEAVLTWNLEQRVDKKRILEAYLNVIELGDGVYGIGPAARRWFGKPARRLTPAEAAFLAAITPAPHSAEVRLDGASRLDSFTLQRTEVVLAAMRRAALVRSSDFKEQVAALAALKLRNL